MHESRQRTALPLQERVEAQGHLIDSHIMEQIFDTVVEFGGRFEVEQFRIGRTNSEPSHLRLKVDADDAESMEQDPLAVAWPGLLDGGFRRRRAAHRGARPLRAGRFLFHHQPPHLHASRRPMGGSAEPAHGRADRGRRTSKPGAARLRDISAGDQVVTGMRGIRVVPESKERDRLAFAFMSNGISSERQVETAVKQTAALIEQTRAAGQKIVVVAGPVVVHTGGAAPLARLIREGYVSALLSGNALGVHDIEAALLGTSLGIRQSDGRQEEHGHRNHMRAINAIYHCGGIRGAVESGRLRSGIMYECVDTGTCRSCWPAACATTARCRTPSPT